MFFLVGLVRFEKRVVVLQRRRHDLYTVERATKEKAKGDFFGGELTAMTSKGDFFFLFGFSIYTDLGLEFREQFQFVFDFAKFVVVLQRPRNRMRKQLMRGRRILCHWPTC